MPATTATKPLPPEVRKRLGQLMPLLSSGNAGECAAAAGAIGRLLSAHGLDWHDLTAAVADAPTASQKPPEPPPRRPPPPPDTHNLSTEEVRTLVIAIREHHHFLNERSKAFLDGQMARAKYGRVLFTDKQWAWLQDLTRQAGIT
jgi:hypothetical protein